MIFGMIMWNQWMEKALIEYSNNMQDVYKNIEEYKLRRRINLSRVFDNVIADMIRKQKKLFNSNWLTC